MSTDQPSPTVSDSPHDPTPAITRIATPALDGPAERRCPHCERGLLVRNEPKGELVCTNCFTTTLGVDTDPPAQYQHGAAERSASYDRDTYEHSGFARLVGGYKHAYVSDITDDREYALDTYGEITDGLWTPHKRD